ncbi:MULTISPECIES: 3-hydroxyacyl-CoA dehydrogenase NAD-binding domain-containing protein [unclassified Beijerinckia]|uniref:3-hydroxyacyl-CoA dehydrogenase NAD-binding domain-containing protein n=1 Tax=unclassified Beijerinckia TaxID=2638183 RepID=UPI00089AF20F|nr:MULTISPECIES: 3-hydroxyacyl-CoA dehydrogenase NAD-binding domain-containing protein [unclassified Beijerinckia]MDH7796970.1 3-hydroxyacyl-CoA dehydrogenase [Beijerinckia sp. GAS462]SEC67048.1 3-hydroxyacyl-CoA dehydrogenase [Beijerinckia sp. 28-YEA-48]
MITWVQTEGIAVVTIDNPPVNAGSHAVRQGLLQAFTDIAATADIEGVVLIGAGRTFIAGSDIKEFGAPLSEPQLPTVIAAIEALPIPVAAAIHGAALGGGYELTLGCDLRVADRKAVVGLPEVGLGMFPGAGGTQRLPRLTGVAKAIEVICEARRVPAGEALKLGMIDAVSDGDLLQDTIAALRKLGRKRRLGEEPVPPFDTAQVKDVARKAIAKAKGRPAAVQAADLVLMSSEKAFGEALAIARAAFQEIRVSPEAFAIRHLFFAERKASKIDTVAETTFALERLAVIGAGTMGAGIAYALLNAGFAVTVVEQGQDALAAGKTRLDGLLSADLERKRLTAERAEQLRGQLAFADDIAAVASADLVIEAVFEDMAVKKQLLERLGAIVEPDAIIATNTSYLDVDALAEVLPRPDRFLGLHFFSPAHIMKLLEVVRGKATSPATLAIGLALAKRLGKQAVVAGNAHGFIGNRIYNAYRRHSEFLIQDGATPEAVDRALTAFGMAMGPFAVTDLSGLDIAYRMRKATAASRDPKARYVDIADRLCEAGRIGRKSGAGYYQYVDGKQASDPLVSEIIAASRAEVGIAPRAIDDDEIRARCLGAIVNEAALLLAEGVAQRASDIDVTLVHGYGFPRWTGGPLWWAAHLPQDVLADALVKTAKAEGATFRAGDVASALKQLTP